MAMVRANKTKSKSKGNSKQPAGIGKQHAVTKQSQHGSRWFLALSLTTIFSFALWSHTMSASSSETAASNDGGGSGRTQTRSAMEYVAYASKLLASGHQAEALAELQEGRRVHPPSVAIVLSLADAYATAQRYHDALASYQAALDLMDDAERRGDNAELSYRAKHRSKALTWMGVVHRRLGLDDNDKAIEWLERSVKNDPDNREGHYHLAVSYALGSRLVDAALELGQCMNIGAVDGDFQLLSAWLSALGHWELLGRALRHCLDGECSLGTARYPAHQVHLEYAVAMGHASESAQGSDDAKEAKELSRRHADEARRLSGMDAAQTQQEINTYLRNARQNRGAAFGANPDLEDPAKLEKAHAELTEAFASLFEKTPTWSVAEMRHLHGFRWPIPPELSDDMRRQIEMEKTMFGSWDPTAGGDAARKTDDELSKVVPPFTCLNIPTYTLEDCVFASRVAATRRVRKLTSAGKVQVMGYDDFDQRAFPPPTETLRIGLFSGDVRPHPMLSLVRAFVRIAHDVPGVTVTLYHATADPAALEDLRRYVDGDVECSRSTFAACLDHARRGKVQVWLETSGSTGEGIPDLSAAGPAPVGVLWAGFPGSMADTHLQYMVSDQYTVPAGGEASEVYPEKMIYVPGSWLISEPPAGGVASSTNVTREDIRRQHGIPTDAIVYSYFGRMWKVDDVTFRSWCDIIKKVPNSYLVMLNYQTVSQQQGSAFSVDALQAVWVNSAGLPTDRLHILPPFRRGEHLEALRALSDVALDTSIYGGGITSYEALYVGLPLVHRPGGWKMMQRAGGSALVAAGLGDTDLIAEDQRGYVAAAVRLGVDAEYRGKIRWRLEEAVAGDGNAVLFRPEVSVYSLIQGIREAYGLWHGGHPPRPIFAGVEEQRRDGDEL